MSITSVLVNTGSRMAKFEFDERSLVSIERLKEQGAFMGHTGTGPIGSSNGPDVRFPIGIFDEHPGVLKARVMSCEAMLADIRQYLNRWADESQCGGWSTHQVKPQQQLAAEIQQFLDRK